MLTSMYHTYEFLMTATYFNQHNFLKIWLDHN